MFDVGFWEIALIGVVTLLVVGPDRLPEVASTAGRWILKMRRFVAGVKADFNRELETGDLHKILGDQKDQINELRSMVDSTRRDLETTTKDAVSAAKTQFDSVEELGKTATPSAVANPTLPSTLASTEASTVTTPETNPQTNPETTQPGTQADAPAPAAVDAPSEKPPAG